MVDQNEKGYQLEGSALAPWTSLAMESAESNPLLVWPLSLDVFDKMRREDAQVASVLRAVMLPIRRTKWRIDGTGCRPEVTALVAADLGLPIVGQERKAPLRTRARLSWDEHVRLALLSLVYGHSVFEQVYSIEGDGLAHLRKLAYRPPRTISEWDVARDGGLRAIVQTSPGASRDIRLRVDRLVVYAHDREGGNWIGQSILRPAYKHWLIKDRELRAQALTIERNGLGVPVYEGAPFPEGATEGDLEAWRKSEREAGLELAKGFRAGESAGASIPNGAKLTLTGVTGKLPDTDQPIRYQDEQIARAVLAHFLNLGTETGSWALGSTFADFFTGSLNAVAEWIVDTAQQHIVEDLVDANWGTQEPAPRLVAAEIGSEHPLTAEQIKSLVEARVLTPDEPLEKHFRGLAGLPALDEATARPAPAAVAPSTESDPAPAEVEPAEEEAA